MQGPWSYDDSMGGHIVAKDASGEATACPACEGLGPAHAEECSALSG